jgi:hypothetical protein
MRVEQPRSTWLADDSRLITRSLRASDTRSLSARASSHWSTPVCFSHAWLSAHHQRRRAASQLSRTSIAAQAASVTPLFAPRCLHGCKPVLCRCCVTIGLGLHDNRPAPWWCARIARVQCAPHDVVELGRRGWGQCVWVPKVRVACDEIDEHGSRHRGGAIVRSSPVGRAVHDAMRSAPAWCPNQQAVASEQCLRHLELTGSGARGRQAEA